MRNIWTIAKREYKLYFISPVAYVIAFLFLIWIGRIFFLNMKDAIQQAMYQPYVPTATVAIGPMILILVFTMPAITMRLLAEEQRSGTIELLLTAPVRDWDVVVGKWLGAFLYMLTLLVITVQLDPLFALYSILTFGIEPPVVQVIACALPAFQFSPPFGELIDIRSPHPPSLYNSCISASDSEVL